MKSIASQILAFSTIATLAGCQLSGRFPNWNVSTSKLPSSSQVSEKTNPSSKPRLIEPIESPLKHETKTSIRHCRHILDMPEEKLALADPTNYGKRLDRDYWGRSIASDPRVIVIHETVLGKESTINLFKTPHINDNDQVSYHLIINADGMLYRIVSDANRAYGAGMSAFGDVTQRIKPNSVGSINNFALHVSLVSPVDGFDGRDGHSGYTNEQYRSLASQVLLWQAEYGIPLTRVTTHSAVDRSHSRYDPRSFRWDQFDRVYRLAAKQCGWQHFDNQQASVH